MKKIQGKIAYPSSVQKYGQKINPMLKQCLLLYTLESRIIGGAGIIGGLGIVIIINNRGGELDGVEKVV